MKITPDDYIKMNEEFERDGTPIRLTIPTQEQIDKFFQDMENPVPVPEENVEAEGEEEGEDEMEEQAEVSEATADAPEATSETAAEAPAASATSARG